MKKGVHFDIDDDESDNQVYLQEDLGVFSFLTKPLQTKTMETLDTNTFSTSTGKTGGSIYENISLQEQKQSAVLLTKTANQVDGLLKNRKG